MRSIFETIVAALNNVLGNLWRQVVDFLPSLISALLIILIGLVLAKIAEKLIARLLQALRVDSAAERQGISHTLHELGIRHTPVWLFSRTVFWVLLILFLVPALETLRLTYVSQLVGRFVDYLPSLLVAVIIMLVGLAIARLLGGSVGAAARNAGLEYATAVGMFVRYFLSLIVIILALAQLGVQTAILTNVFIVMVVSLGLAVALSLGLGSRAVVSNILAGAFVREHFPPGRDIQFQGMNGKIIEVGAVGTAIETDGRQITVPNTLLMESVIE